MIEGRRVTVPLFELAADPKVSLATVKGRRFLQDVPCPVCGARVPDLLRHCREAGDGPHAVAEVMVS